VTDPALRAILDALTEAVFVIDGDRRVLVANQAARELTGTQVEGQGFARAIRHPDCLRCVEEVLAGNPSSNAEITPTPPASGVHQVKVVALDAADVSEPHAVISIVDVSHVHDAERMRSDFVANVSHELRSPLTALIGFVETLKGPAKDDADARASFLSVMEDEALRMNRLIDDLLSLSKVEVNQRLRPTERVRVDDVIHRVITTLSQMVEEKDSTVAFDRSDTLPDIVGDTDQLTQVFQNLIENALKYGRCGQTVTVSVTVAERSPGIRGPALCVDVTDEGPGIPAAHIPRLTERFYRVDAGRSRNSGGTGLGLAIVKHIVNRHQGRLNIRSEEGRGTTFSVLLPIDAALA